MDKITTPPIDDRLLYRRQFFFAPRIIEELPNWKNIKVNDDYYLTLHPDLEFAQQSIIESKIIVLGFILDPDNPNLNNDEILQNLLKISTDFNSVIKNTYNFGGRWLIIHMQNDDIQFFHDAAGSQQLFYTFHNAELWCASQPHTIANQLGIKPSENQFLLEFINSNEFEEDEHCMVGDGTIFPDIYHLMPNHSLSIQKKIVHRYWPDQPIPKMSINEATGKISKILFGLYESANNRYDLMQSVTAGVDSRALLAATKAIKSDIYYFIQKFDKLNRFSPDIWVPKKYLPKLGIDFHINKCDEYDQEFDKYLNKNVYMIQSQKKKILYYNFFKYFQGKLNVSGNIGGIIRHSGYDHFNDDGDANALAKLLNADNKIYVLETIQKWLDAGILGLIKKNNIYLKDLFYWEHRGANWIPMFQTELNIAIDEWNPTNCRNLIIASFAVPPDNKQEKKRTDLYKNICKVMWPETLDIPISPTDYFSSNYLKNRAKYFLYKFISKLGLLNLVKRIKWYFQTSH